LKSNDNQIRLFIGIPLPRGIIESCVKFHADNKELKVRWVNPENLHITTFFIGDRERSELDQIINNIQLVCNTIVPFSLEFQAFNYFPNKKPYMIWGKYSENESFTKFCTELKSALSDDEKSMKALPHITLARYKRHEDRKLNFRKPLQELYVDHIVLWESVLSETQAVYKPLKKFKLKITTSS